MECGGRQAAAEAVQVSSGAQPDALLSAQKKNCNRQTLIGLMKKNPIDHKDI